MYQSSHSRTSNRPKGKGGKLFLDRLIGQEIECTCEETGKRFAIWFDHARRLRDGRLMLTLGFHDPERNFRFERDDRRMKPDAAKESA